MKLKESSSSRRMPTKDRNDGRSKKLAVLNRRIVRLSSELETLQFMQDRLARELEPGASRQGVSVWPRRPRQSGERGRRGSRRST